MATKIFSTFAEYKAAKPTLMADDVVTIKGDTLTAVQVATLGADALVDFIRVTAPIALTVSQFNAAKAKLNKLDSTSITIGDTPAVINKNLAALLADNKIGSIDSTSDTTAIKLTAAQAAKTANTAKLQDNDTLVVADTSAHINAKLDALLADSKIDTIDSSDNVAINLTVAQAIDATSMDKLLNADRLVVSDTSAHINTQIAALLANSKIDSIDSTEPDAAINLNAAQAASAANMAKLLKSDKITVIDNSANINSNLTALLANNKVDFINSYQDGVAITLTTAQAGVPANLGKLQNSDTINVVGTSANIQANLDALLAHPKIDHITSSSNTTAITLTAAQALVPANLDKLSADNKITVALSADDVALSAEQITALNLLLVGDKVDSIVNSYTFSSATDSVTEGSSGISFTVTSLIPVTADTSFTYSLQGNGSNPIIAGDVTPPSGTVKILAGQSTASFTLNAPNEGVAELDEGAVVNLKMGATVVGTQAFTVADGSSYALAANTASQDEGKPATFTVNTVNVADGIVLPYTLTGISAADVVGGALSGNVTVKDGMATIDVVLKADILTEGAETLTVTVADKTASMTVNDTSKDATFALAAGQVTKNEGDSATFTLTSNDAPDGSVVDYTLSGVSEADVTGGLTGSVTMQNGTATITVPLVADALTEGAETLTVTAGGKTAITSVIDKSFTPTLVNDTIQVIPGAAGSVAALISQSKLLENDTDSTGAVLTGAVSVVPGTAVNGTTALSGNDILFIPTAGQTSGSFQYSVAGVTGTATANIIFNTTPVATAGALAVTEGSQATGAVVGTDADAGQTLTYTLVTGPTKGTLGTINPTTGAFTYDYTGAAGAVKGALAAGVTDTDTFTFTATDNLGKVSDPKTVTVTTTGVNDSPAVVSSAPAAVPVHSGQGSGTGTGATPVTVDLSAYATDPDAASGALTYALSTATTANGGHVTLSGHTASISYDQGQGSSVLGADTFSFTVTDGVIVTPVAATVNLTVTNTAPVASAIALDAKTGVSQVVDMSSLVSDADGNTLTPIITVGSLNHGGSAEVPTTGANANKLVYTSTVGFVGTETLEYTVTDGFGGTSSKQTITFTVASNTGGTSGNDLLYGSTAAENIDGLGGDDTIVGGGGLDTVTGGTGNDTVTFSDGAVQILGAAGSDTLIINSDAVASAWDLSDTSNQNKDGSSKNSTNITALVRAFENIDASKASSGITLATGGVLAITTAVPDDSLTIADLNDEIGDVADTTSILGSGNDDRLAFGAATGSVTVAGNDGSDWIYVNNTAAGTFSITGGAGNDIVYVEQNSAKNTVIGGAGNDIITNKSTADSSIDGGDGNDTITGDTGKETMLGGAGNDIISSGGGNDSIDGGAGNDRLTAGSGTDTLVGGLGNDTLIASTDADSLDGGDGDDTFTMAGNLLTTDTISGGAGTDTVSLTGMGASLDLSAFTKVSSIEAWNVTATTNTDSVITAGDSAGLTNITFNEDLSHSGNSFGVTGMTTGASLTLVSNTDSNAIGDITVSMTNATGTADALTVNLRGDTGSTVAANVVGTLVATGYETLTIDSGTSSATGVALTTAAANTVSKINDIHLTTLNLTGASPLTITTMAAGTAPTTVNAGSMTAALNFTTPNASALALTGGSGNDTFALGTTIGNTDVINGGAGTLDALTATVTGLTATTGVLKISGVEAVNLTEAGTTTIDALNISGTSSLNFAGGSTALTVTNLPASGMAVGLGFTGTATNHSAGSVTASLVSSTGTSDSLTFNLQSSLGNTAALVTTGIENVTLAVNSETNGTNSLTLTNLAASKLTVSGSTTGNDDVVALGTLNAATTTVVASGFTGPVTATASASNTVFTMGTGNAADYIKGAAGNDTVTFTSLGATAESVEGGTGTGDTLTITSATAALNFTNVKEFETINVAVAAGVQETPSAYSGFITSDVNKIVFTGGGSSAGVASTLTFSAATHTNLTAFDASGYSGVVTLVSTTTNTGADSTVTITGGSGTADMVSASYSTGSVVYAPVISGFETVNLGDTVATGGTIGFDLTKVTGASTVAFATSNVAAATVNVTGYDGSTTLQLGVTAGGGDTVIFKGTTTSAFGVTLANSTGSTDALNLRLVDTDNATNAVAVSGTGIEVVNINAGASTSTEDHKLDLSAVATTSSAAQTINITGGMDNTTSGGTALTITNTNASANVINASSYIGDLTLSGLSGSSAMTITGGTGADNILMKNAGSVLDGSTQATGSGGDTLTVSMTGVGGSLIADLSSTVDQVSTYNGQANSAVQKGFESINGSAYINSAGLDVTGSSAGNVIVGSAVTDVISAGLGADTVTGGAGGDTISLGGVAAVNDILVYAAGVLDTVSTASSIAGVDKITDAVFNAAVSTKIDLTATVAVVNPAVSGSVTEASFVSDMDTLLHVATNGFNVTASANIAAAVVTVNAGGLSGHTFLAVDLDSSDSFTVADYVIDITGSTVTSLTTATFI